MLSPIAIRTAFLEWWSSPSVSTTEESVLHRLHLHKSLFSIGCSYRRVCSPSIAATGETVLEVLHGAGMCRASDDSSADIAAVALQRARVAESELEAAHSESIQSCAALKASWHLLLLLLNCRDRCMIIVPSVGVLLCRLRSMCQMS